MSIPLPLFNYSPEFYEEVVCAGILYSSSSILRLKCFSKPPHSRMQQRAIKNFELWSLDFVSNSHSVFHSGSAASISLFKSSYDEWLLNCLLTAELYAWEKFAVLDTVNSNSYVQWSDGVLINSRRLSDLL